MKSPMIYYIYSVSFLFTNSSETVKKLKNMPEAVENSPGMFFGGAWFFMHFQRFHKSGVGNLPNPDRDL